MQRPYRRRKSRDSGWTQTHKDKQKSTLDERRGYYKRNRKRASVWTGSQRRPLEGITAEGSTKKGVGRSQARDHEG